MNNNPINNNELDAFSEKLKSKLENHQLAPDADLWNSIQQSVGARKRRRMPVWLWIPMSSVAVLALILMLRPNTQSSEILSKGTQSIHIQKEKSTNIIALAINKSTFNGHFKKHSNKAKQVSFKLNKQSYETPSNSVLIESVDTISIPNSGIASTATNDSISSVAQSTKSDKVQERKVSSLLSEKTTSISDSKQISKPKFRNQWLLAAAFGSGSSASSGLDNVPLATLSDNIVKTDLIYNSIMSPQSFSDVHYSLPLSVGLKIRNKFSERLSIETGLIYTYLQTDFSNSGFTTTDARLGLHYLGIPVSLNLKVWNNPKWEVYVSGGGTIEKGLRSIYQQTQNNTYQTWITTAQTNIDGLQFSANSALGVGYKIMPKIGVFFEPQFSYYFQNNQPISIRSHQPAVFSMQVGLRYNLNSERK